MPFIWWEKFFNGEENEKDYHRELIVDETPEQILDVLGRYGWKMFDHDEVCDYSKWWLDRRDRENERELKAIREAEAESADLEELESIVTESEEPEESSSAETTGTERVEFCLNDLGLNEDEESESGELLIKILVAVGAVVIIGGITFISVKAYPKVKEWVRNKFIPSLKDRWAKLTGAEKRKLAEEAETNESEDEEEASDEVTETSEEEPKNPDNKELEEFAAEVKSGEEEDEKLRDAAERILSEHRAAFEELAK